MKDLSKLGDNKIWYLVGFGTFLTGCFLKSCYDRGAAIEKEQLELSKETRTTNYLECLQLLTDCTAALQNAGFPDTYLHHSILKKNAMSFVIGSNKDGGKRWLISGTCELGKVGERMAIKIERNEKITDRASKAIQTAIDQYIKPGSNLV